jgi:hypothetical protein
MRVLTTSQVLAEKHEHPIALIAAVTLVIGR